MLIKCAMERMTAKVGMEILKSKKKKIAIIGAGPAGVMAGITASKRGLDVIIFERNEKIGKKLFITGKGRCNLTNACEAEEFFEHLNGNKKFMYSAFYGFDNRSVMDFIEENGCPVKIERGNRVFPVSDHSCDVIQALKNALKDTNCKVRLNEKIESISVKKESGFVKKESDSDNKEICPGESQSEKTIFVLETSEHKKYEFDGLILATGGKSYTSTGSTGDGYKFAKAFGHTITNLRPSLLPLKIKEEWCPMLQGLSLKNVSLTMMNGKKKVFSEMGEMLFTHEGVSGPLVLTASSFYARLKETENVELILDLKPALTTEQLDKRFQREFEGGNLKQLHNILPALYPARLATIIPDLADVDRYKKVNTISREERNRLVSVTKGIKMTVTGTASFEEAIITCGGVSLKEVNPSTMESKLVPGLFFAGEILDLDAHTGGYNLQIAWSTGHLAGENILSDE